MHRFNLLMCFLILMSFTFSCKDHKIEGSVSDDVLKLKISKDTIVLNIVESEEIAVTFSWSTGTNYGTGKAINYCFNIAVDDEDYNEENSVELGKHHYSVSYTVEELNDLVLGLTSILSAESEVLCKARVIASVPDEDMLQISEVPFVVKTYRPLPEMMYIKGTALAGEDPMDMIYAENGVFVWQGNLNLGDISVFNDEYGLFFTQSIEESGRYTILADLLKEDVSLNIADKVYFVCEENSWKFIPMDTRSDGVYSIIAEIKSGQFKFGTIPDVWHYMYVSSDIDNAPWDSKDVVFKEYLSSEDDKKWFIWNSEDVPYEIILDTRSGNDIMEMRMTPYHTEISLVGDATDGGWSLNERTRMEKVGAMIFHWSGTLNKGEMKFCCGKSPSYGKGEWLMPMQDQTVFAPAEESVIQRVDASVDEAYDYKWRVNEAGYYDITLNQYTLTLTIKEII